MTLLRSELTKVLFQKRTYIGWLALLAIPVLVAVALHFGNPGGGAGGGPSGGQDAFFTLATHNGLLVPLEAITMLASFFLPLVASMAGGFQLAGEAESGTLKTWLVHPVNRGPDHALQVAHRGGYSTPRPGARRAGRGRNWHPDLRRGADRPAGAAGR